MNIKIIILILFSSLCLAQKNRFEIGYYIDNQNNKIEGLIKNEGWDFNPTEFKFKVDSNSSTQVVALEEFQEFSVNGEYKFKKVAVKIDKSTDYIEDDTSLKELKLVDEEVLLRVHIEGKANLYSYITKNYTRFFYNLDKNSVSQLSYKIYYDKKTEAYRKNETYKQELYNNLKCDKITQNIVEKTDYTITKLSDLFTLFNNCSSTASNKIQIKNNLKIIDLYAKLGIGISSLNYINGNNKTEINFGNKTIFRPALEAEVNLLRKAKNFSIMLELSYQNYEGVESSEFGTNDLLVNYKSIDFSAGFRKYFFLNSSSKLFLNSYITYGIPHDSKFFSNLTISKTITFAHGVGYLYDNKYILEIKFELDRNLINKYVVQGTDYNSIVVNLGYKFL